MTKWIALFAVGIYLAACATPTITATVTLADACLTADAALKTATTLDKQGKLTPSQVAKVTSSGNIINGICGQSSAPINVQGAINVVLAEVPNIKF